MNLSKHEHCLNSGIREYLPCSITWQTWRKHDAKRGRGGKERLLARVLSFVRSIVMTQPGEIDGVMKQMTQSFNPVIHRRIQETMRNPTVLKWLALSLSVTFTSMIPREVSHPRSEIIVFSKVILREKCTWMYVDRCLVHGRFPSPSRSLHFAWTTRPETLWPRGIMRPRD